MIVQGTDDRRDARYGMAKIRHVHARTNLDPRVGHTRSRRRLWLRLERRRMRPDSRRERQQPEAQVGQGRGENAPCRGARSAHEQINAACPAGAVANPTKGRHDRGEHHDQPNAFVVRLVLENGKTGANDLTSPRLEQLRPRMVSASARPTSPACFIAEEQRHKYPMLSCFL